MTRTDVLIAMAEIAHTGGAVTPEDAIGQLAMIIDSLELSHDGTDKVMEMLLRNGACVWNLQQECLRL